MSKLLKYTTVVPIAGETQPPSCGVARLDRPRDRVVLQVPDHGTLLLAAIGAALLGWLLGRRTTRREGQVKWKEEFDAGSR
jgi:hypothetical protein